MLVDLMQSLLLTEDVTGSGMGLAVVDSPGLARHGEDWLLP